jgi:hypothetical protein
MRLYGTPIQPHPIKGKDQNKKTKKENIFY